MCGSEPHIVYSFFDDWEESREFDRVLVIVSSWCCALRVKGDHSDIYVDVDYAQDRLLDLLVRLCPEDSLSMESYKLRHGKSDEVLATIKSLLDLKDLSDSTRKTLTKQYN